MTTTALSDWMGRLLVRQRIGDADSTLDNLVLIGAHDAATASISRGYPPCVRAIATTQHDNVLDLLQLRGVRYLDVRIGGDNNDGNGPIHIFHGCVRCGLLQRVLEDVRLFLDRNSSEFVVLEVVLEYGKSLSEAARSEVLDMVREILEGDHRINNGEKSSGRIWRDCPSVLRHTPFREVILEHKKQVLVLLHSRFYGSDRKEEERIATEHGYFNSERWFSNPWHNTNDADTLQDRVAHCLQQQTKDGPPISKSTLLRNAQLILTPQASRLNDVFRVLTCQTTWNVLSLTRSLHRTLPEFLRLHGSRWNVVSLDFVDQAPPSMLSFLISLNGHDRILIERAVLLKKHKNQLPEDHDDGSNTDVTDTVASFVVKDKVLYLTDPWKDLAIQRPHSRLRSQSGTIQLAIDYRFSSQGNNSEPRRLVRTLLPLPADDQALVLSAYTEQLRDVPSL